MADPDPLRPQGLIAKAASSQTPVAGYTANVATADKATSTGYDPTQVQVTPSSTVQTQLDRIIAKDSPLMQQAERRAKQAMNARGLLNSSIAVGAGQDAVIQNALPIAQQDASTFHDANVRSVDAQNAAKGFKATADNQASQLNAQLGTDVSKQNAAFQNEAAAKTADAANTMDLAKLDYAKGLELGKLDSTTRENIAKLQSDTQMKMAQLDNQTKTVLSAMDNQYRQLLQASQTAANLYNQTVNAIANISIQPNLSANTKNAAIASQINILNEGLKLTQEITQKDADAVASLDIGKYFQSFDLSGQAGIGQVGFDGQTGAPAAPGGGGPSVPVPGTPEFARLGWQDQAIAQLKGGLTENNLRLEPGGPMNFNPDTRDSTIRILNLYSKAKNGDTAAQAQFRASAFGYPNAFLNANVFLVGGQVPRL
jgi:hypothetical protein